MTIPRQVLLNMVAEAHYAWVVAHDASTPFRPERYGPGSDYHQHVVDLEASPDQEADLHRRIETAKAVWLAAYPGAGQ
ncbi:hypothetical protein acdb102_18300 [Acidothermaceae bacterium B102]|nr:hypothetical protein acdb102_18300 [Acidothermaceae bacterium B102]